MSRITLPDGIDCLTQQEEYALFAKYFSARILYKLIKSKRECFYKILDRYFTGFIERDRKAWDDLKNWIRGDFKEAPDYIEELIKIKSDKDKENKINLRKNIFLMASFAVIGQPPSNKDDVKRVLMQGWSAYQDLVTRNVYLVMSFAARCPADSGYFPDAFQEGIIGLMMAITRFRPWLGYRLSTYATYYITERIKTSYHKFSEGYSHVVPFLDEDLSARIIDDLTSRIDSIDISTQISNLLGSLKDKHKCVILAHYCDGKNFSQIASEIGLSRERVRQIHNEAINIIKDNFRENLSIL